VSHTKQARSDDRRPTRHELQGADTCTSNVYGYEWTCSSHHERGVREGCGNRLIL